MNPRRRGFILFFGTKPITQDEPGPRLRARCPSCERDTEMLSRVYRQWFTVFFIPVFPIGKKLRFSQCLNCSATFRVPVEQLKSQLDQADSAQQQRAIGLYNALRASPGNAITLNELLTLYAGMNEFDQAISAARDFPAALESSEQCMTTLGRVLLTAGRYDEAIDWFARAIERNPALADAQYFKALAHLNQTPADLESAHKAARAARHANHPDAEMLIKQVEEAWRQ